MHLVAKLKEHPDVIVIELPPLVPKLGNADYLAAMCHEIGTPLSAIIGLSEILATRELSPEKKAEYATMIKDSSAMLMELLKNMLDSSKMEAGMIEVENINFDLGKVVQEAANIIGIKAAEKGLNLHVHIANDIPSLCIGDPLRIRQILLNLLSNALKFTEKGHIRLCVDMQSDEPGNDQICFTVMDTGSGMNESSLKKIFNKYVQADSSISRKYGGTGLGLSISQDLAHLMHGNITVESWLGLGSRFEMTLPLGKVVSNNVIKGFTFPAAESAV